VLVRVLQLGEPMASKKLTPGAGRLTNPAVKVRRANPSESNGDEGSDPRTPADRDGNEQQARGRSASGGGKKAARTSRSSVARRRAGA
jgi:hypothetical protein